MSPVRVRVIAARQRTTSYIWDASRCHDIREDEEDNIKVRGTSQVRV